jgi:protein O-mannosyl-transferase
VCVESVAWVTERKNTLSMVLVLLAANALLRREATLEAREPRRKGRQADPPPLWLYRPGVLWTAALTCFTLALFAKTTAALLPAVILVLVWWRKGRIRWDDLRPLLPFFVVGALLAWNTAHIESTMVGATGAEWSLGLAGRIVLAGRVLAFYVGKFLWPSGLLFIYPRWAVDPSVAWQWLPAVLGIAAMVAAFTLRTRLGRGPLAALLLLGGVTFPAMGFFNVYAMRYSYVADHFAYQAAAVLSAVLVCGLAGLLATRPKLLRAGIAVATAAVVLLGGLTFAQATVYRDEDTLWRHTLAGNPECFMCHTNYGYSLYAHGRMAEAVEHFQASLKIRPDNPEPLLNLARVEEDRGQLDAAIGYASQALRQAPSNTTALVNMGTLCVKAGLLDEAIGHFRNALAIGSANDYLAHNGLGAALMQQGHVADAVGEFRAAVAANPAYWKASANLDKALQRLHSPTSPAR